MKTAKQGMGYLWETPEVSKTTLAIVFATLDCKTLLLQEHPSWLQERQIAISDLLENCLPAT